MLLVRIVVMELFATGNGSVVAKTNLVAYLDHEQRALHVILNAIKSWKASFSRIKPTASAGNTCIRCSR